MSDKKPNVIPTLSQIESANQTGDQIANQLTNDNDVEFNQDVTVAEANAAAEMARITQDQINKRQTILDKQHEIANKLEEDRKNVLNERPPVRPPVVPPVPPSSPAEYSMPQEQPKEAGKYITISQPQTNSSFDLVPLPSEGKLYKNKKKAIRVSYLNASDENILTNPNLMESGEFLEIILNRKILEEDLRYKDLHVGDRNAIMIWLRATAYGHDYPITVFDPESTKPFEHIVDLSQLKIKNLGADTDKDGYFDYVLELTKIPIKFKLLTVGDVDDIDAHVDEIKRTLGEEFLDTVTYTLGKQIVEINGNKDRGFIDNFIQTMRAGDSRPLRKNIDEIESGVDMKLEIETPGGESLNTFLPLNVNFFWPDLGI